MLFAFIPKFSPSTVVLPPVIVIFPFVDSRAIPVPLPVVVSLPLRLTTPPLIVTPFTALRAP
jgi:hypothetical protein